MPRDGLNQYAPPPGTQGIPNYTVESSRYNVFVADITADQNNPRPVVAGGTGASTPDGALDNLSAEKFKMVVANWDTMVWRAGSFYALANATGIAPGGLNTHAFAGIAYYANATDLILRATDLNDPLNPVEYIRIMTAGVWGNWMLYGGSTGGVGEYTFDSTLTFPPASGQVRFNNATQNSTTEIFISHLNALGADNTGALTVALKAGLGIYVQDKDEPAKYKIFVASAAPVISGGDFRITVAFSSGGANIVSGQRVLMSTSSGNAVSYDIVQALTEPQAQQARQNIYAAPFDALAYNGMQTNGSMEVSQELGTVGTSTHAKYIMDGWWLTKVGSAVVTASQSYSNLFAGFQSFLNVSVGTAQASIAAGDAIAVVHSIEGFRISRLYWGQGANAQPITIGFWTAHNRPGVYGGSIRNQGLTRSYPFTYTQAFANIPQFNTVTIPGELNGIWFNGASTGMYLTLAMAMGATFIGAPNAWASTNLSSGTGQINGVAATTDVFRVTGVVVLPGLEVPSAARAPFIMRPYDQELLTCLRYFENIPIQNTGYATIGSGMANNTTFVYVYVPFKAIKRASPSMIISAPGDFVVISATGPVVVLSALSLGNSDAGAAVLACTAGTASMVAGSGSVLQRNATNAAKMAFDGRL